MVGRLEQFLADWCAARRLRRQARLRQSRLAKARYAFYVPRMDGWIKNGKVRGRITEDGALEIRCHGLTTQAKYYKTLLREFFRKDFTPLRPGFGDYDVHIVMEYTGDAPWMDLDNLAKALLDSVTGNAFEDDHQVARLLVERRVGDREGIYMRVAAME